MQLDKDRTLYVGGLTRNPDFRQLEKLFGEFGKVEVRVMAHRRDCVWRFAYVTFEKASDASNAMKVMNGFLFHDKTLRVERYRSRGWRNSDPTGTGTPAASSMIQIQLRTPHRVAVSGLPENATWHDLKTHFQKAGPIAFADIHIGGTGIVEFQCSSDMRYALKNYDGSKISTRGGATGFVTVREDGIIHFEQPVQRSSGGKRAGQLRSVVNIPQGTEARSRYIKQFAPAPASQLP